MAQRSVTVTEKRSTKLEHEGLTVLIENLPGRVGGTMTVWASSSRAAARAHKLEKVFNEYDPSGSRGESRYFFYWWHDRPMPSLALVKRLVFGAKS